MSPLLYHYTSYSAFCSITSRENLRFTNIGFLNDALEYQYGIGLFIETIQDFERKNNIQELFDVSLINRFTFQNQLYQSPFARTAMT